MKNFYLISTAYYKKNGLLGICCNSICQLRGGDNSQTSKYIDYIIEDDRISESYKKPFRSLREDPVFPDSEKLRRDRLLKSLIAKTNHRTYSIIKAKIPYALLTPFTFSELSRLAAYRLAGFSSAPLTVGGFIGFSMPCAVTFSMLEMYAPDKFKFPCKCAKWTGGIVFYGVCSSLDYLSSGLENKFFGEELPIDAPQLMGTLPKMSDLDDLKKLNRLAESIMKKSTELPHNP
jgi:hypothetical protein